MGKVFGAQLLLPPQLVDGVQTPEAAAGPTEFGVDYDEMNVVVMCSLAASGGHLFWFWPTSDWCGAVRVVPPYSTSVLRSVVSKETSRSA